MGGVQAHAVRGRAASVLFKWTRSREIAAGVTPGMRAA
jgi:hypothetical protein